MSLTSLVRRETAPADAEPDAGSWAYLPALDGLRAIAVYLVLAFHAGLGPVGGGFVGVDLFFVLSGFLVASILLAEQDATGRIALIAFYGRRVRRLLPAAVAVIVATAAVYLLIASQVDRDPLIGDARSALLYVANWRFLGESGDYFDSTVLHSSPFLHFWSLSIEEQFYLLFPVLLIGLLRLRRRWPVAVPAGIGVLFVGSLLAQVLWAGVDPTHAYYGTDARAYQLLAGVLLALAYRHRRRTGAMPVSVPLPVRSGSPLAWTGLAVLLVAASGLGFSQSLRGLVATLAASLLVLGLTTRGSLAGLLSRPVPVRLGRISYGTYLWHWPVLLVLRQFLAVGPLVLAVLTAVLATALAALSFEFLETPVRRSATLSARAGLAVAGGVALSLVAALVLVPGLLGSQRRPVVVGEKPLLAGATSLHGEIPAGIDYAAVSADKGPADVACTPDDLIVCRAHQGPSGAPRVLVVGDSQARMLSPVLTRLAEEHDFMLYRNVVGRCPWADGMFNTGVPREYRDECAAAHDRLYRGGVLTALDPDLVIFTDLDRSAPGWLGRVSASPETADEPTDVAGQRRLVFAAMKRTIGTVRAAGAETMIVPGAIQIPGARDDPLDCLASSTKVEQCLVAAPSAPSPAQAFATTLATTHDDVHQLDLTAVMCPSAPLCGPVLEGRPVWRDRIHYSPALLTARRGLIWHDLTETEALAGR